MRPNPRMTYSTWLLAGMLWHFHKILNSFWLLAGICSLHCSPSDWTQRSQPFSTRTMYVGPEWMKFVTDNAMKNQDHLELGWILNCLTSIGRLSRMTTWKSRLAASRNTDESNVDESLLNAGLLTYPSLQAADILVYRYALSCPRLSLFICTKGNSCPRRWRPNPTLRTDSRSCRILQSHFQVRESSVPYSHSCW